MNYLILVNRNNLLENEFQPNNLVNSMSKYKDDILVEERALEMFKKMQSEAAKCGYFVDIMSGYRSYAYQDRIYHKLILDRGFNYAFRHIAPAGASEHQTGLAIDICVYRGNKCYIENEISDFKEIHWLQRNAHRYGFILRYPYGKENITGYNYEPWHFRYVGKVASVIYNKNMTLEEYLKTTCK